MLRNTITNYSSFLATLNPLNPKIDGKASAIALRRPPCTGARRPRKRTCYSDWAPAVWGFGFRASARAFGVWLRLSSSRVCLVLQSFNAEIWVFGLEPKGQSLKAGHKQNYQLKPSGYCMRVLMIRKAPWAHL